MTKILPPERPTIFFDGDCTVCNSFVRFLKSWGGEEVFISQVRGEQAFTSAIPEEMRKELPDSVVVLDREGKIYVCWPAIRFILERLSFPSPLIARIIGLLPESFLNKCYQGFARRRKASACSSTKSPTGADKAA